MYLGVYFYAKHPLFFIYLPVSSILFIREVFMIIPQLDPKHRETIETVKRMAWLAEYRDTNTPFHLERIRGYVLVLATGLGVPEYEAEQMAAAAMLHDIGKVGLPDALLSRTGALSPAELEAAKRHTGIGHSLICDTQSPVLQLGAKICLSHHERWDGSGYPQGLRGEQIPLAARLMSMADVFDALTTPRSYKKEVGLIEAREIVREAAGKYFEPGLVKVFLDRLDALAQVRRLNI